MYRLYRLFRLIVLAVVLIASFSTLSCKRNSTLEQNQTLKTDSVLDIANGFLNSGEINRSARFLDSAYATFPKLGPIDQWRKYNFYSNLYLYHNVKPIKAEKYVDSMFASLKNKESMYESEYAQTFFAKGDVLRIQRRYDKAFESYYQGHSFAKEKLDSCQLSGFSARLGLVRFVQQHYLKAIPYFKQALSETRHCPDSTSFDNQFVNPQSTYNSIALSFERANLLDSALYYYLEGLAFIKKTELNYAKKAQYIASAKGVFYGNLGGLYVKMKDYANGEQYLKQSISINDRPGYAIEDAQTAKAKLIDLYLRTNRIAAAKVAINELEANLASREGTNEGNVNLRNVLYNLKSRYFDSIGDKDQAFHLMLKYNALRDSLAAVTSELKSADMDAAFKHAEQQHSLAIIKRDRQLKTLYLATSAIILAMAIVILIMVWLSLKRSRTNVAKLTSLNKRAVEKNEQLQRTLSILEQSQEDNAQLMKLVAHDLRSPIGAIDMLIAMMVEKNTLNGEGRELAGLMKQSAEDCLSLVAELLQPAVLAEELKKEPEDLYTILNYCIEQLKLKAKLKSQQLLLHGKSVIISVNAVKIWRVINNLIGNSIKFSHENSVIEVSLIQTAENALISVKDSGIGIPNELKANVFDIYSNDNRLGTAGEQTFGLGLAIAKQIVKAHNGKIWFESKVGVGTIFYVELPLDKPTLMATATKKGLEPTT